MEKETIITLTDTHFGVRQNSIMWLNSQKDFIYNEFLPAIKRIPGKKSVYHCGDVFDSRVNINSYVASVVRKIFEDIAAAVDSVIVIAGNHDFYSPTDDSVDSVEMVLRNIDKVTIVKNTIETKGQDMFVPWFQWFDYETLKNAIETYNPKAVWCHTDLSAMTPEYKKLLKGIKIFTGHIHYPSYKNGMLTMGSTFALTFADCNADRGFYIVDASTYMWRFVPAKGIIHFWRFYNDEVFTKLDENKMRNDYIEIYIDKGLMLDDKYVKRIKEVTNAVKRVMVIPQSDTDSVTQDIDFKQYDIESICRSNVPEYLADKFEQVVAAVKRLELDGEK